MSSVKTWRRTALAAYVVAGVTLPLAGYTLATIQANVNAVSSAQERLADEEQRDRLADLAPVPVDLDTRPYSAAVDWSAVAATVMPSVVMISTMPAPFGDGSQNRAALIPGVQTNQATAWLTQACAWLDDWDEYDQSREWYIRGAGFVIGDGHQVATAAHVLDSVEAVRVILANGESRSATVVAIDRRRDVAVLSIEGEPGQPVTVAPGLPRQGQAVATIGSPQGLSWSFSAGLVSRYGKASGPLVPDTTLQIAGPITGGNSGGLVFNTRGEAVGLVSFGNGSFNHAVPVRRVLSIAKLKL